MTRSEIIKDLIVDKYPIKTTFNRLKLITEKLNNHQLKKWIHNEINGYEHDDIPSYRVNTNYLIKYSGGNYSKSIKNATFPKNCFPDEIINEYLDTKISSNVNIIEEIVNNREKLNRNILDLLPLATKECQINVEIFEFYLETDYTEFLKILDIIKDKLLNILLELEKEFGNLDEMDIEINHKNKEELSMINQTINNFFMIDNSIKLGDDNKINDSNIGNENEN